MRNAARWLGLGFVLLASAANAQNAKDLEPSVDTSKSPPASAMEPAVDTSKAPPPSVLEPGVDTSAATNESSAPTDSKGASAANKGGTRKSSGGKAMDRLELDTTAITGNRELPKVLVIVPWKRSDLGDLLGKPVNSLLDEVLQPVDRDVFKRENRYFTALDQGTPVGAAPTGSVPSGSASQSAVSPATGAQSAPVAPK